MTHQQTLDAAWSFATASTDIERDRLAALIADGLHHDADEVAAVLTRYRGQVDGLYEDTRRKPSQEDFERVDSALSDALAALPEVVG